MSPQSFNQGLHHQGKGFFNHHLLQTWCWFIHLRQDTHHLDQQTDNNKVLSYWKSTQRNWAQPHLYPHSVYILSPSLVGASCCPPYDLRVLSMPFAHQHLADRADDNVTLSCANLCCPHPYHHLNLHLTYHLSHHYNSHPNHTNHGLLHHKRPRSRIANHLVPRLPHPP